MEVSHFELIYKPQAPVGPGGTGAIDTVLQGYFLEITNLEPVEYLYRLEFVAAPPAGGRPERSLSGNTLVFIDTPGVDNAPGSLTGGFGSESFFPSQGYVRVPPHATALVAVLPSVFGSALDSTPITAETFEVRGFVRITLPALRRPGGPFFRLFPQSNAPVRTLLTPQSRTSYYKRIGAVTDLSTLSDQTQATLTTASGAGLNLLAPEPGGFSLPDVFTPIEIGRIDLIPVEMRPVVLASLLAQVDEASDFEAFNRALAESDVPISLGRRDARARGRSARTSEPV